MPRKKQPASKSQTSFIEPTPKTAPCIPAIRRAVDEWRVKDYEGVSDTTHSLLNFWFKTDHRLPNGRKFAYHKAQREAIETLIYLYEVAGVRRHKTLVENYAGSNKDLRLLQFDDFARYCIKMATGSGKTKVMALAIAWQYFNSVAEARDDYARTFLLFAPNVIVFERLRHDFASGRIFRTDPVIPEELKTYWDFDCYMRGDAERAQSLGALYLSNIQQFYERADRNNDDEPDVMTAVLGSKPPAQKLEIEDFDKRILARGNTVMVINDEAHHTHDEESEWNSVIRRLHDGLIRLSPHSGLLSAQLDFTATPRYSKGALFTWTVYDYPLKQAIEDGIVKRPIKGITRGTLEAKSTVTSTRYKAYLTAGVERWKEYFEQLKPLKKKPILFVMMNDTNEADDVGDYLQKKYPSEFGGNKLLVIHTDTKGEITRKDLDKARKAAREVDDLASPVNAIVSVLMLREGWDVPAVAVILLLRKFSSRVYGQQVIGRGLRLNVRNEDLQEICAVVDHEKLQHGWLWEMVGAKVRKDVDQLSMFGEEDLPPKRKPQVVAHPELLIEIPAPSQIEQADFDEDVMKVRVEQGDYPDWKKLLGSLDYTVETEITRVEIAGVVGSMLNGSGFKRIHEAPKGYHTSRPPEEMTDPAGLAELLKGSVRDIAADLLADEGIGSHELGYLYGVLMDHVSQRMLGGKTVGAASAEELRHALNRRHQLLFNLHSRPGLVTSIVNHKPEAHDANQ